MICLDSDVIIEILKGNNSIKDQVSKYEGIVTTRVNVHELLVNSKRRAERLRIIKFIDNLNVLTMNKNSALISSSIFRNLKSCGKEIGHHDTLIAGILRSHGCKLIATRNKKHFTRINGLEIIAL